MSTFTQKVFATNPAFRRVADAKSNRTRVTGTVPCAISDSLQSRKYKSNIIVPIRT